MTDRIIDPQSDEKTRSVRGWRKLSEEELEAIDYVKTLEEAVAAALEETVATAGDEYAAHRHLEQARAQLELGFMLWLKAIGRPTGGLGGYRDG